MDSISCILTFESYNYNIEEVRMKWNEPNPVILYKDIELPDFTLINFSTFNIEAVRQYVICSFFSIHERRYTFDGWAVVLMLLQEDNIGDFNQPGAP